MGRNIGDLVLRVNGEVDERYGMKVFLTKPALSCHYPHALKFSFDFGYVSRIENLRREKGLPKKSRSTG